MIKSGEWKIQIQRGSRNKKFRKQEPKPLLGYFLSKYKGGHGRFERGHKKQEWKEAQHTTAVTSHYLRRWADESAPGNWCPRVYISFLHLLHNQRQSDTLTWPCTMMITSPNYYNLLVCLSLSQFASSQLILFFMQHHCCSSIKPS